MSTPPDARKIVNSNSGWNALTLAWSKHMPRSLAASYRARQGIRALIRTGR